MNLSKLTAWLFAVFAALAFLGSGLFGVSTDWIFAAPAYWALVPFLFWSLFLRRPLGGRFARYSWLPALLGLAFFWARARFSLLESYAVSDACLVLLAGGGAWLGRCAVVSRRLSGALLSVLFVLLALNSWATLKQYQDPSWVPWGLPAANPDQITGLFFHRNYFAAFVGALALLALAAALWVKPLWLRALSAGLGGLGAVMVLMSASRGGVLGFGVGLAGLLLSSLLMVPGLKTERRVWWLGGLGLALLVVLFGGLVAYQGVLDSRGQEAFASNGRKETAWLAMKMGARGPLLGRGARSFEYEAIPHWEQSGLWQGAGNLNFVHNEYAQVWVDYGFVGLALLLGLLLLPLMRGLWVAFRLKRRDLVGSAYRETWPVWLSGGVAVLLAALVQANFSFIWHFGALIAVLGLALGALSAAGSAGPAPGEGLGDKLALWGQRLGILLLMAGSVWAGAKATPLFGAQASLWRGDLDRPQRMEVLETLLRRFPDWKWQKSLAELKLTELRVSGQAPDEAALNELIEAYAKAHELHPKEPGIRLALADRLSQAGRFEEAEGHFLWVLEKADQREYWLKQHWVYGAHLYRWARALYLERQVWPAYEKLNQAQKVLESRPRADAGYKRQLQAVRELKIHLKKEVLPYYPREDVASD